MAYRAFYLAHCPECGVTGWGDERQKGFGLSEYITLDHAAGCPDARASVWATVRAQSWDQTWQVEGVTSEAALYPRHDGARYGPIAVGLTRDQARDLMRRVLEFTLDSEAVAAARAERDARWAAEKAARGPEQGYVQYCAPDDAIKISGAYGW